MQVTVKDIKVKEGTTKAGANAGKLWKLIILTGQDGSEFTTFDASAQEVGIGGVIELEPVIKAGKINFTEFKIIQKGSFQTAPGNGKTDSMTPELWEEKDKRELWSREANACFMGLPDLINCQPTDEKGKQARNSALDYAVAHFNGQSVVKQASKPSEVPKPEATKPASKPAKSTAEVTEEDLSGIVFENAGALLNYLKDDLEMNEEQRKATTAGFNLTTEQGRKDCWASILKTRGEKGEG